MKVDFKLPKAVKTKWVKALRSGEYKQGKAALKEKNFVYDNSGKEVVVTEFCCLGVARDLGLCARKKPSDKFNSCTEEYVNTKFLPLEIQKFLADKNDGSNDGYVERRSWGFNKIANWIEKNL